MSDTSSDDPLTAMTGERDSLTADMGAVLEQRDQALHRALVLEGEIGRLRRQKPRQVTMTLTERQYEDVIDSFTAYDKEWAETESLYPGAAVGRAILAETRQVFKAAWSDAEVSDE